MLSLKVRLFNFIFIDYHRWIGLNEISQYGLNER